MADIVYADRVKEKSATTGTGTYSLDGAESGHQTFVAGAGTGNTCYYCATDGADWEVGIGTVTDATPDTLARTTILASSNAGLAVNWAAGNKDVFSVVPANYFRGLAVNDGGGISVGNAVEASGLYAVAGGFFTTATAQSATAFGSTCNATNTNTVAIGSQVASSGLHAVGLGSSVTADMDYSIAIGSTANVGGAQAIAIGRSSNAATADSVALGYNLTVSGINSIGIKCGGGITTNLQGDRSVGIGVGIAIQAVADNSVAIGDGASTQAIGAVAIGRSVAVSGAHAAAIGGNFQTAAAEYSVAFGKDLTNNVPGSIAHGNDDGECALHVTASRRTIDATGTLLQLVNANAFSMGDNRAWGYKGVVTAYEPATGDTSMWEVNGCVKRVSGTTSNVGTPSVTQAHNDVGAGAWTVSVAANDTTDALDITVTGEASHTIDWTAYLTLVEASA